METQTSFAGVSLLKFALACGVVAGLMAIMAWILRRFVARGWILPKSPNGRRRLHIVETLALDARRRIVIVKCDETETLLLLGAQDLVIKNLPPAADSSAKS